MSNPGDINIDNTFVSQDGKTKYKLDSNYDINFLQNRVVSLVEEISELRARIKLKIDELESWDSTGVNEIIREAQVNTLRDLLKE
jgi:hypothetical protein